MIKGNVKVPRSPRKRAVESCNAVERNDKRSFNMPSIKVLVQPIAETKIRK